MRERSESDGSVHVSVTLLPSDVALTLDGDAGGFKSILDDAAVVDTVPKIPNEEKWVICAVRRLFVVSTVVGKVSQA